MYLYFYLEVGLQWLSKDNSVFLWDLERHLSEISKHDPPEKVPNEEETMPLERKNTIAVRVFGNSFPRHLPRHILRL